MTNKDPETTLHLPRRHRPSFGRSRAIRGLDLFDTPTKAMGPLFAHEPLLANVTSVCEPFVGKGNLAYAMRKRGIEVHASDIIDRGCLDAAVIDFFTMTEPPAACRVIVTNPPFRRSMEFIEHALAIGFDVVVFLAKIGFLCTADRFERLHKPGHLRRVHTLAGATFRTCTTPRSSASAQVNRSSTRGLSSIAATAAATIVPVSIANPAARMPWI